eukprot:jgi/Picsp_1/2158/NSC_05623-R1_kinase-like protein
MGRHHGGVATPRMDLTRSLRYGLIKAAIVSVTLMGYMYTATGNQILPGYPVPVNTIEAGSQLACAIDNEFDIDCWGLNVTSNKINHPVGPDFISLSCGNLQCCAVSNSSIECWGDSDAFDPPVSTAPDDARWMQVSVSTENPYACAIIYSNNNQTSSISCWGPNDIIQQAENVPELDGDTKWKQVLTMSDFICALNTADELSCWGNEDENTFDPTPAGNYQVGAAGVYQLCLVTVDGELECFGRKDAPQIQLPQIDTTWLPNIGGAQVICAIDSNTRMHCWGDTAYSQDDIFEPNDEWTAASGAQFQACGIRAGLVQCWSDLDLERAVQVPDIAPRSWGYTDSELRALVSPERDSNAKKSPPASQSPAIGSAAVIPSPEESSNSPPAVTVSPSPEESSNSPPAVTVSPSPEESSNSPPAVTVSPSPEESSNSPPAVTVSPSPEESSNSPPAVTVSPSPDPIETETPDTEGNGNSSNSTSSGGSSSGTTIGIAVGVSVAVILVAVIAYFWYRHNKKEKQFLENANKTTLNLEAGKTDDTKKEQKMSESRSLSSAKSSAEMILEVSRSDSWMISTKDIEICKDEDGDDLLLGKGGYGRVVKAIKGGVQEVALKIMDSKDPGIREACIQEAEIMKLLHDQNIVHLYGVCRENKKLYVVMEYMGGGDLAKSIANPKLRHHFSWGKHGKKIALDIIKGLCYLHSKSMLHRDIKTQNILLDESKTLAKIGDVGVSRFLDGPGRFTVVGTLVYIAPEILRREPYDLKADIYSFGVVLRELITRQPPTLEGPNRDPIPGEECPQEICDLISRCLSNEPGKRPKAIEVYSMIKESR